MTVDLERFERTPLVRDPFEHLVVREFVKRDARRRLPEVTKARQLPLERDDVRAKVQ
jgi:hypothetical protein